jgi:hypothetical protein
MSKEKLPTAPCSGPTHNEHMCALADEYFHVNCPDQYRAMVKDAEFKCLFCGRTAKSKSNLCYPAEL